MIEHNVGELFEYNNHYLMVIENSRGSKCFSCWFLFKDKCLCCSYLERNDKKNVYFKYYSKSEIRMKKLEKLSLYD